MSNFFNILQKLTGSVSDNVNSEKMNVATSAINQTSSLANDLTNKILLKRMEKKKEDGDLSGAKKVSEQMMGNTKFANSGFGEFANSKAGAITGAAFDIAGDIFHKNRSGLQRTDETARQVKNATFSVLNKIPVTAPFSKAVQLVDKGLEMITGNLGNATTADKILSGIPLGGSLIAGFTGKTHVFKGDIQDINTGDFGGTINKSLYAQDISGVKSVRKKMLNRKIDSAQRQFDVANKLVEDNKLWMNNNLGSELTNAVTSHYLGNQHLSLAKNGMKIPELEEVRALLNNNAIKSFKNGGKLEKDNIIPTGALHKNLHHIEEINPELEGKITKKGIPVGIYDENGEFEETCEIESGEIVFSLDVTKQIEEYWQNYKESWDDNIAIECGKYLVDQIFNNTRDDDKVIKKTE